MKFANASQAVKSIFEQEKENRVVYRKIMARHYEQIAKEFSLDKFILVMGRSDVDRVEGIVDDIPECRENLIAPVFNTLEGNAICVGFGDENSEDFYYLDFNFGLYFLDHGFSSFQSKLEQIPPDSNLRKMLQLPDWA